MKKLITALLFVSSLAFGQVYISEYSDAGGTGNYFYEFVEIYNDGTDEFDASNCVLRQANSTQSVTIPNGTSIPAKGFLIVARDADKIGFESFWGITLNTNVTFINSGGSCPQMNGDEVYLFENSSGINIDPATDNEFTFQALSSLKRVIRLTTGNSSSDYDGTKLDDSATPGNLESNQVLPVELTTFSANIIEKSVSLNWETATEVNNYGFNVERKPEAGEWSKVAFVEGHGNSNSPKYYSYSDKSLTTSGKYLYRLKQVDIDGTFEYSDAVEVNFGAPEDFVLNQNYPNPFNPTTSIQFTIPLDSRVRLSVFNVLGEEVAELVNQNFAAGYHSVNFNGSKLNSGIYFYKLEANNFMQIRKMMLVK